MVVHIARSKTAYACRHIALVLLSQRTIVKDAISLGISHQGSRDLVQIYTITDENKILYEQRSHTVNPLCIPRTASTAMSPRYYHGSRQLYV